MEEMDPQGKIWLRIKVFEHCILSCNVSCPNYMVPEHANEKMSVVDNDGHSHPAILNLCPRDTKTIPLAQFMDIYVKIKNLADEEKENLPVDPNN